MRGTHDAVGVRLRVDGGDQVVHDVAADGVREDERCLLVRAHEAME
jgi:hypothetical protein